LIAAGAADGREGGGLVSDNLSGIEMLEESAVVEDLEPLANRRELEAFVSDTVQKTPAAEAHVLITIWPDR
jgi:hypothetical protein